MPVYKVASKLRKIKREKFKEFLATLSPFSSTVQNFKFIKRYKNRFYKEKKQSSDINTVENPELHIAFTKLTKNYVYKEPTEQEEAEIMGDLELSQPIQEYEVRCAIKKAKKKSAPGTDGINYAILKAFKKRAITFLTKLYNHILETGNLPSESHKIIIKFIDKLPKKGYRPIVLENTIMKILERIINERLVHYVEKKHIT